MDPTVCPTTTTTVCSRHYGTWFCFTLFLLFLLGVGFGCAWLWSWWWWWGSVGNHWRWWWLSDDDELCQWGRFECSRWWSDWWWRSVAGAELHVRVLVRLLCTSIVICVWQLCVLRKGGICWMLTVARVRMFLWMWVNGSLTGVNHIYSKGLSLLFYWFGKIKFVSDCRFIGSYWTLHISIKVSIRPSINLYMSG